MKHIKYSLIWAVLLGAAIALAPAAAPADDSELFISRVWPNVLLMIDKSGSMSTNSGSTGIGDLDGDGSSNSRMDALWKVVYTLLNADLSIPQGGTGGGTTVRIECEAKEYNGDENVRAGTAVSNIRLGDCDNFSSLPSSATVSIGRFGRVESKTYTSKGTCPGGSGNCIFFSPAITFTYDHGEDEPVVYTSTTGGGSTYQYTLPYPSPSSPVGTGAPNEHDQAIGAYHITPAPNLTSADEAALKARIGLLDFTGNLPATYAINIRNQIPSNAPNNSPFSSPIRYQDIWQSIINNATPSSYTPTAQALVTARTFFQNAYNVNESCRPNYAILITDGEDTMGMSSGEACSGGYPSCATGTPIPNQQLVRHNRIIEKGAALYDNTYKTKLFTVGVGIGTTGGTNAASTSATNRRLREILRRAADQLNSQVTSGDMTTVGNNGDNAALGSGRAFFADDATQLTAALSNIFQQMTTGDYVFTSPTVSSVRTTDRNYLFMGSFIPKSPPATQWRGSLEARTINSIGSTTLRWDADNTLATTVTTDRRIYTSLQSGGAWQRKNFGNNPGGNSNQILYASGNPLSVASSGEHDNVLNYVRGGGRTYDTGDPTWKLGDIFHSKPVLVGEPSSFYSDEGYSGTGGFYSLKRNRNRIVYAGANDGTLHAFLAGVWNGDTPPTHTYGTGAELFAYVPSKLLSKVRYMIPTTTSSHRYYVDSSARVADVWLPNSGSWVDGTKDVTEWKTVLIAGMRKGGQGYFALDVTDPPSGTDYTNYPNVLWEYDNTSILADTWSEPYIAKVKYRNDSSSDTTVRDRWVAIFGGGKSGDGSIGNKLIVMDIATGTPLRVFDNTAGPGITNEIVASPNAVLDSSGYIRYIYVPDVGGNLYRFNFSAVGTRNTGMTEWTYYKVFAPTSGGQPAYQRSEVATISESLRYVYFGTGNKDYPVTDNGTGKFFAIKNADTDNTTVAETSLTDLSGSINSTNGGTPGTYGWKIILSTLTNVSGVDNSTHSGEKVLSDPVVFNGNVYFTTYTPTTTGVCTGGGVSRLYGLNYLTAGAALASISTSPLNEPANTTVSRHVFTSLGVASSPSLSINPTGTSSLFVGFSGVAGGTGSFQEISIFSPSKMKNIKSWKEIL